jgi:N-acetyl-alpha-D-muramate 1-phosphate uridylyltransferase
MEVMSEPQPSAGPDHAMVLAAGLGLRMRPLTDTLPKPLVPVAGRALIDHILDPLAAAGVSTAVVNVHYRADQMEAHLAARSRPLIVVSDEREALLDSGGGVTKALPHLGAGPFYIVNADSFWIDGPRPNLARLAEAFQPEQMDILMLVAATTDAIGYDGRGDYAMDAFGALRRRVQGEVAPFVYAGVMIVRPEIFAQAPAGAFSLNTLFDRAEKQRRLFGLRLDGIWLHVGTPAAVGAAEAAIAQGER